MKALCLGLLALLVAGAACAQGRPHVHGVTQVSIAVETGKITIALGAPLDNLLGFEREPRGVAEQRRAHTAVAALKAADTLFRFTPQAGCAVAGVELRSAALKLGAPDASQSPDGHGELDGTYVFSCTDSAQAAEVDVGLFDAFIRMQRLQIQVVTPRGQFKRDLKRPAKRVSLVR